MGPRLTLACLLAGCASLNPRFDQDVQASFAEDEMRRLTTADVELYYPAAHAEQARLVAARASECLTALRRLQTSGGPRGRALLFLTSANLNNAYVGGQQLGEPLHSVNPLTASEELFHWWGFPSSDLGDVACHEMFHYAHWEQVDGLWKYVNLVVGPVMPSQAYLERWFGEGVAVYYEGRLARQVGRPHSPFFGAAFDSFVAMRNGVVEGGDLTNDQRQLLPHGGAYLTGYHFIEYLVATHGEEKLWALMERQGKSVFTPFGVALRFRAVYGRTLNQLLEDWSEHLRRELVIRRRPTSQRVLVPDLGQLARLASHRPSGTLAVISSGVEEVPTLRILRADGTLVVERRLIELGIDREYILASPYSVSGLSFSPDGRWLYLTNSDLIARGDTRAQLWRIDASTGEVVKVWQDLGRAVGGAVSPDGAFYTMVEVGTGGGSRVVDVELATLDRTPLLEVPVGRSLAAPAWSPSGERLALSVYDGNGWNLMLREPDGTVRQLTSDGEFNYGAQWEDGSTLVFARTRGRALQVHRMNVDSGEVTVISDTAYGLLDPRPLPGGEVAIINRDGIHFSLDVVAAGPPLDTVTLASSAPPPPRSEPPPLEVQEDGPYSGLDQLFVPQLRAPGVTGTLTRSASGALVPVVTVSLSLQGRDRLGHHTWAVNGALDVPTLVNSVSVGYRNAQLAPWLLTASASRLGFENDPVEPGALWSGLLSASRSFWVTRFSVGARALVDQPFRAATSRYIGPFLGLSYGAAETTAYGGPQRQLTMSLDTAVYPRGLGSDRDIGDVRVGVSFGIPLPFTQRHSFLTFLTGRVLPGAPERSLRLGGIPRGTQVALGCSDQFPFTCGTTVGAGPGVFLPGGLSEAVRGFDDYAVRATATLIASARYRYSVIIDRGWASVLWIFPSLFFRQVDVEPFGTLAVTDNPQATFMRAAGAAVWLRLSVAGFATSLYYQFAYRFDFGLPPLHTLGLVFE